MAKIETWIKTVGRGLNKANQKTAKFTRSSKINMEILGLKREIEEKLLELGGNVYERMKHEPDAQLLKHLPIRHLIEQLKELENELKNYYAQLEQIKSEKTLNKK